MYMYEGCLVCGLRFRLAGPQEFALVTVGGDTCEPAVPTGGPHLGRSDSSLEL